VGLPDMTLEANLGLITPKVEFHPILQNPSLYLPVNQFRSSSAGSSTIVGLSEVTTEAELVKFLAAVISNNFETHTMTTVFMGLTEDHAYFLTFEAMLGQQMDTVSSMAEKLLHPAVRCGRLDLVKAIVASGVDVNLRDKSPDSLDSTTALEYAVEGNHKELVKHLLDNGATDWQALFRSRSYLNPGLIEGTVLDLAIDRDYYDLVEILLQHVDSNQDLFPRVPICVLRNAILLGRIKIVKLIISNQFDLVQMAERAPWHFYEAAATINDTDAATTMIEVLRVQGGFDIQATSSLGHGSMLAAAVAAASANRFSLIVVPSLLSKASMNTVAAGGFCPCTQLSNRCHSYGRMLHNINGDSALHVAINNGCPGIVRLLLYHGADAEQHCGLYLI
jgi:ankyrin repeat protein